jgi:hypothetical protein
VSFFLWSVVCGRGRGEWVLWTLFAVSSCCRVLVFIVVGFLRCKVSEL